MREISGKEVFVRVATAAGLLLGTAGCVAKASAENPNELPTVSVSTDVVPDQPQALTPIPTETATTTPEPTPVLYEEVKEIIPGVTLGKVETLGFGGMMSVSKITLNDLIGAASKTGVTSVYGRESGQVANVGSLTFISDLPSSVLINKVEYVSLLTGSVAEVATLISASGEGLGYAYPTVYQAPGEKYLATKAVFVQQQQELAVVLFDGNGKPQDPMRVPMAEIPKGSKVNVGEDGEVQIVNSNNEVVRTYDVARMEWQTSVTQKQREIVQAVGTPAPTQEKIQQMFTVTPEATVLPLRVSGELKSELIKQTHNLSCESATGAMLAEALELSVPKDFPSWEEYILSKLPRNADPSLGFRGNPDGPVGGTKDYGVYAEPLAKVLQEAGISVKVEYGADYDKVKKDVLSGKLVIVWVDSVPGGKIVKEKGPDGKEIILKEWEHVQVVYGVTKDGKFMVHDPYWGSRVVAGFSGWGTEPYNGMRVVTEQAVSFAG